MSQYTAVIKWQAPSPEFVRGKYSREHTWSFDGGITIRASSSPSVVPAPYSNPACVDPEEAFVASISSCHMLTFIWLASRKGFEIESYVDEAVGTMTPNERGVPWMSSVVLRPAVRFTGSKLPSAGEIEKLHHEAHEECYIANSIKTNVTVAH